MNPDTAELAIVDPAAVAPTPVEPVAGVPPPAPGTSVRAALGTLGRSPGPATRGSEPLKIVRPGGARPGWLSRLRSDPQRMLAVRDSARALVLSRLLVWAAGVASLLAFGFGPVRNAFDPPGVTRGFGRLGDLLAGPAARWDASWYLVIAHYGYRPDLGSFTAPRTAFFPLYPLGLRTLSDLGAPPILAGVLISVCALACALYGIHRLTTLELEGALGRKSRLSGGDRSSSARGDEEDVGNPRRADVARLAVLLTAFAPMAFYFSAVYTESLFLALSVGVFWCARNGRWRSAALLGALAGATRSTGIVLALPVLMLYLYGPREDRPPDFPRARLMRPRYRPRADLLWLALLPAGVGLYMAWLGLSGGDPLMPFHAQDVWDRHFVAPYGGIWDGAVAAFDGLRQLLSMQRAHVYFTPAGGSPFVDAGHNLVLFAFLLAAVPAIAGVLRRLPLAYGVYVLAALALPLSSPVTFQPLMSLPRFLLVLFPLTIWLAAWLLERPRGLRIGVLACSAALLALAVGEFATWHWVA